MTRFLDVTAINATAYEYPETPNAVAWSRGDKLALLQLIAMPLIPIICGLVQNMMAGSKGRLFTRNNETPDEGGGTFIMYASCAAALMKRSLPVQSTKDTRVALRLAVIQKKRKKATFRFLNVAKFKRWFALRRLLPLSGKSGDQTNILPIHEEDIKSANP